MKSEKFDWTEFNKKIEERKMLKKDGTVKAPNFMSFCTSLQDTNRKAHFAKKQDKVVPFIDAAIEAYKLKNYAEAVKCKLDAEYYLLKG